MNIALYGGKFDPIQMGHINLVKQTLIRMPEVDQMWLIPARTHPWRKLHTSAADRLAMLKRLETTKIKICDVDLARPEPTRTIDTIKELRKRYPDYRFYWICGSDTLDRFDEWEDHDQLVKLLKFMVIPRPGFNKNKLRVGFYLIPGGKFPELDLSSTEIRSLVKSGKSIHGLVPLAVEKYISKHKLYRQ